MTSEEREAFLAESHVGVVAIERADGPPLAVPIWYGYEPGGEVLFVTQRTSLKGRLVERSARFSLCAQQESVPYRYVSAEGPATISPADRDADLRPMAHRYLGTEMGDQYADAVPTTWDAIRVAMTPDRWFSVDYAKAGPPGAIDAARRSVWRPGSKTV